MMAAKSERRNLKNSRARFFGLKSTCLYECRCDTTSQLVACGGWTDGQTKNYTTSDEKDETREKKRDFDALLLRRVLIY